MPDLTPPTPRDDDATPAPSPVPVPPLTGDVSVPPAFQPAPVYASAPADGALGGYPPLGATVSVPAPAMTSRLWLWLTVGAAALLVIAGTTTVVAISALTPRNESLAQKACLAETQDEMKNPASTKFTNVLVGKAWDKKAAAPVVKQWIAHATLDDVSGLSDALSPFENAAQDGLAKNTFVVTAAVDGTNSYGAVVRQYALCYVGINDTKVARKAAVVFTSSN